MGPYKELTIQTLTVLSVQAVARCFPSGENCTRKTGAVWVRVMTSADLLCFLDRDCQHSTGGGKVGHKLLSIYHYFLSILALELR